MTAPAPSDDHNAPTMPDQPTARTDEALGERIGRYKVLQKLGEGGCGTVYLAEQEEPVRRRVALKVIKPGMDTREVIARFEAERQALALMDHPNIAKVLDAGTTAAGRPFFVLELVRGMPITQYCDENNLPTAARLGLFDQVCHAIQHAHQKGIIHRDIKPSNVLVTVHDGEPVPKVIDFGIAKATQGRLTNHTFFTAIEQFVGTPAYMSPEQAALGATDIDTRSDVYSLGVLLYELLTGRTPFDFRQLQQAGIDEVRRHIRDVDATRPSTSLGSLPEEELTQTARRRQTVPAKLISGLRGDLDWIALRCLEKDRNRRYATASDVANDLRHFLRNEPVSARPPSTWYLLRKLAQRHRVAAFGVSAVAAAVTFGVALTTWPVIEVLLLERKITRGRAETATATHDADRAFAVLREEFTTWLSPDHQPPTDIRFQTLLDRAAGRLEAHSAGRPETGAQLHGYFSQAYLNLDALAPAQAHAERALALARQAHGKGVETVRAMGRLALVLGRSGKVSEALEVAAQMLASRGSVGAVDEAVFNVTSNLANHYQQRGELDVAETIRLKTFEARRRVLGEKDPLTLDAMNSMARAYLNAGRWSDAEAVLVKLVALRRGFWPFEDKWQLRGAVLNLNIAYSRLGKRPEEAATVAEMFELDAPGGWWKREAFWHVPWQTTQHRALILWKIGRTKDAGKILARAGELQEMTLGADDPATLLVRAALATVRGEPREAKETERQLIACNPYRKGFPPTPTAESARTTASNPTGAWRKRAPDLQYADTLSALINLADFYKLLKKSEEEAVLRTEIAAFTSSPPGESRPNLAAMQSLANGFQRLAKLADAEKLQKEVVDRRKSAPDPDDAQTVGAMLQLVRIYTAEKKTDDAEAAAAEAASLAKKLPDRESARALEAFTVLDELLKTHGKLAEAERVERDMLALVRKRDPKGSRLVSDHCIKLAQTLNLAGKFAEAEPLARESLALREKLHPTGYWNIASARSAVGASLLGQRNYSAAEPLLLLAFANLKQHEAAIPAAYKSRVRETAEQLVQLYTATDQLLKATEWKQTAEELAKAR